MFENYLKNLPDSDRQALQRVIDIIHLEVPDATEGLAYGLPSFRYKDRPLIGFSSNKHGLNIYPFDPRIVSEVIAQFPDLDHSKAVIRFTPNNPLPESAVLLLISLRKNYLEQKS